MWYTEIVKIKRSRAIFGEDSRGACVASRRAAAATLLGKPHQVGAPAPRSPQPPHRVTTSYTCHYFYWYLCWSIRLAVTSAVVHTVSQLQCFDYVGTTFFSVPTIRYLVVWVVSHQRNESKRTVGWGVPHLGCGSKNSCPYKTQSFENFVQQALSALCIVDSYQRMTKQLTHWNLYWKLYYFKSSRMTSPTLHHLYSWKI